MRNTPYYSKRIGNNPEAKPDLTMLRRLFFTVYKSFLQKKYFQEAFGYDCGDGDVVGKLGSDIEAAMFLKLRKRELWPIQNKCGMVLWLRPMFVLK